MRVLILPIILSLLCASPAFTHAQQPSTKDKNTTTTTYINPRFGFKLTYPSHLKSSVDPPNGSGKSFTSPDGDLTITAQGHFLADKTLKDYWEDQLKQRDKTVTYSTHKEKFFVISGTVNDREYYTKFFIEGGNWVQVDFTYPSAKRSTYDPLVEQVIKDFIPFLPGDYDRAEK